MNRLSPQLGKEVKHKPSNISALPDSVNLQLEVPALEPPAKPAQAQDLQKSDPGARDPFKLRLDLPVLCARLDGKGLSLTARYILGIITAYLHYGCWRPLSMETIARAARCSRDRVIRAIRELKAARYLDVDDDGKCNWYRVPMLLRRVAKIWVNPALVRDDGLSIVRAVWVSLVKFRQGDNERTWLTHRKAAEILGVSYPTIYRTAAWGAAQGYVQKDHRPWRRSSKNSYALTCQAQEAIGVFRLESARSKHGALGQTIVEGGKSYARSARLGVLPADFGLSFDSRQDGAAYAELRNIGVRWRVARSVAVQWRGRAESVHNMAVNAIVRRGDYLHRMRRSGFRSLRFNLAGYAVRGLNTAMAECHDIQLSKQARATIVRGQGKAKVTAAGGPADLEFEQRKKEQIRRLEFAPAKPATHYTDAELALINSKRDKSAEAVKLNESYASAHRRYHRGGKWTKPTQKERFPVDPCS